MFHIEPNDLSTAIQKGDVDRVAKALNQEFDPNSKHGNPPQELTTSLELATSSLNGAEIAELLIMRGASIDDYALNGASPACTKLLLEQKANPNTCEKGRSNFCENTPLKTALVYGDVETVKLLLLYNADPTMADEHGNDARTVFKNRCVPLFRVRNGGPQLLAQLEALLEGAIADHEQSAADEKTSGLGLR